MSTGRAPSLDRWSAGLLLGLVLLSTGRSLANGFAFDDVPIIVENAQVHQLAPPWEYARQSYWPPHNLGDAYRPWTVWWFAIQWLAGGGSPVLFHSVSLALTAVAVLLVHRLARRFLSPAGALAAAALFAVHPVHVEATGNVVGQAELWMTSWVLTGCLLYARARGFRIQAPKLAVPTRGQRLALAGILVLAAAAKEQGIVLPGLLLLLEIAADRITPLRERVRALAPTFGLLAATGAAFLLARYLVLGDLGGGPPAAGLAGLGTGDRLLVMLSLFPEWARLLVWPAHLRAQYSPPEFGGAPEWNGAAVAGLVLLLAAGAIFVRATRRLPALALGIGWIAAGGIIVSNLPFPTGVLIAERTLFLPSVGAGLAAGAVFAFASRFGPAWLARGLGAGVAVLVALGAARSWSRQAVWRDNHTLFTQTVIDAPRGYRGYFMYANEMQRRGDLPRAITLYRKAASLYQGDVRVFEEWGQALRSTGRCGEAVPIFERGVRTSPTSTIARSRLFECLLALGRVDEARKVAEAGLALGLSEFNQSLARLARRETPPRT